jgi:hypothetical protein
MNIMWIVGGGLIAVAAFIGGMWVMSASYADQDRLRAAVALVKIMLSSLQILNQLSFTLDLEWPGLFKEFTNHFVKLFSFDMIRVINLGCVTSYNFYHKWMLTFFLIPGLLLLVYLISPTRRHPDPGAHDRCLKMGMLMIYLLYPTVTQTMFQTFSCTKLAENEEWLDADFQIDCGTTEFLLLEIASLFGVCIYPIGIPVLTLVLLLRNKKIIREGNGHGLTESFWKFLIEGKKPEYLYWDCVGNLRQATLSGLLIFVSRGSFFQLMVATLICLGFALSTAWCQPYESGLSNRFRVATETSLLITLCVTGLLRVDQTSEKLPAFLSAPGGGIDREAVGIMLVLANTLVPVTSLLIGFANFGIVVLMIPQLARRTECPGSYQQSSTLERAWWTSRSGRMWRTAPCRNPSLILARTGRRPRTRRWDETRAARSLRLAVDFH